MFVNLINLAKLRLCSILAFRGVGSLGGAGNDVNWIYSIYRVFCVSSLLRKNTVPYKGACSTQRQREYVSRPSTVWLIFRGECNKESRCGCDSSRHFEKSRFPTPNTKKWATRRDRAEAALDGPVTDRDAHVLRLTRRFRAVRLR